MFFLLVLLSINFASCLCQQQQTSMLSLEKEDTSVDVQVPSLSNYTTTSQTACHLQCLNNPFCCFVQIKEFVDGFICSLFRFIDIKSVSTRTDKDSNIFGVVDKQRKCIAKDCLAWFQGGFHSDGVYNIDLDISGKKVTKIFCDMSTNGGGWTVIQKRINGAVDFDRPWNDYKYGFGDVEGEYWVGNEFIHQATNSTSNTLIRIDGTSFQDVHRYIIFKGFWVESESSNYKLHTGVFEGGYESLGNNWLHANGFEFSTRDRDNDVYAQGNCALLYSSGWWYDDCFAMNPNGRYWQSEDVDSAKGIHWYTWLTFTKSLKAIKMSIKLD